MTRTQRRLALTTVLFCILTAAALYVRHRPPAGDDRPIVGMVRQTEIAIEPEISGRIAAIDVTLRERVRKGQVLAKLSNPEVVAALDEARAVAATARAARDRVYAGPRDEEVATLARNVDIAQANLTFAHQQKARSTALAPTNYVSKQRIDQDSAAVDEAEASVGYALAALAEAKAGPTPEERAKADAAVAAADAAVVTAEAQVAKTIMIAPADGTVGLKVGEIGEAVTPGEAILNIYPTNGMWFGFAIREDRLGGLHIGQRVVLASDRNEKIAGQVVEMRPLGEFAVWRATRAVGDHDLSTLWIRIDPVSGVDAVEPGMAVRLLDPSP